MTAIEDLARHIAGSRVAEQASSELVRLHTLDTLAAWAAGAGTPEGQRLAEWRAGFAANDIGADIVASTATARLSEIDDIHLASMTTPGAIVVPAAFAIAVRHAGTDGRQLAPAILAGYEAMTRLGLAFDGPTVLYRGLWPTYFAAGFGVAAVAARLIDLDAAQTAHALALALTLAAPGVGHHNAPSGTRWLAAGFAARNGWQAALAAKAGFTADLGLLDGPFFKGLFNVSPDTTAFFRGLGDAPMLTHVSFKPWCGARQTMAAVQAVKELLADGVAPSGITAIRAHVLPAHIKMIDHGVIAGDRASHLTSLPYQIAQAVMNAEAMHDVAQSPASIAPPVDALMQRVEVIADETLLAGYPARWSARVVATTPAGPRERTVWSVPGGPEMPWGETEVTAKLRRHVGGPEQAQLLAGSVTRVLAGSDGPSSVLAAMQAICAGDGRHV